jgi:protein TonB
MTTHQALFKPPAPLSNNDSLLIALFIAAIIHVFIGLGIHFTAPQAEKISRSIDVTLVTTPAEKAPEKAQTLAQENQLAAGAEETKPKPKPKPPTPPPSPPKQVQKPVPQPIKQVKKIAPEQADVKVAKKLITQQKAEKKVVTASKPDTGQHTEKRAKLSAEMLQQQIAQLGTEIRLSPRSAEQTKIKFVESVSAHKYVAAQYMKDWEDKVERTGNLNYPEVATKKDFAGTLTMDVGIKADGSIYSIRINRSSGNPALDEAAKRIVRMSAPFAPLPTELQKELDVLVITRVWKFSDESGMSTR